jgi:arylsulfatase A-like enzyme
MGTRRSPEPPRSDRRSVGFVVGAAFAGLAAIALWPVTDARWEIAPAGSAAAQGFLRTLERADADAPNIVVVLADDLGKYDTSLYGPGAVSTPRLEELAAGGVRLESGYVTAPVCSPSRAALMTGRYPQRFGFELLTHDRYPRNRLEWWASRLLLSGHGFHGLEAPTAPSARAMQLQGIPASEITLAEVLAARGYATGIFGKWHLGFGPTTTPEARGFAAQYGFRDAFSLYGDPEDPDMIGVRGKYFIDWYQWWRGRSGGSAIRRNGAVVEEHGYLTTRIAEEASAWILNHRDGPFFAYVPFNAPHAPLQAPRSYVERFASEADPDRRVYLAMVAALDDAVGMVLDALDRAGVADETLVFFLSDNGAASYTGLVSNAPLAGGKLTNFEGGVNVPFVARWPGRIAAGGRFEAPVSAMDVFATSVAAAGVRLPADRALDGVDLLPWLGTAERPAAVPHEALFWRVGGHRAVRAGDYKLLSDRVTGARALYDMRVDPGEQHDLAASRPALADDLEERLRRWEAGLVDPLWPPAMEFRFHLAERDWRFPL